MTHKTVEITHLSGLPGSGKTTQSELISQHIPGSEIIDTGDIIRKSRNVDGEFHVYYSLLEPYLDGSQKGELIPDQVMVVIAREEIRKKIAKGVTHILTTGYPRTGPQDEDMLALERELLGEGVILNAKHVLLDVGPELAVSRAEARIAKAALEGAEPRKDDLAVHKRLQEYATFTVPMIDKLKQDRRIIIVDGVGSIDMVGRWTLEALNISPNEEIIARAVK